jgi:HAMP domain-containing protein
VLSRPVVLVVVLALAALVAVCLLSAWRWRRVDFIHQLPLGADAEAVAAEVFDQLIPVLVKDGYTMVAQGGHTTVYEHRFFPAWTVLASIFLFPVGLVALLARSRETVVIVSGDRVLELHGYCGKVTADFIVAVADAAAARLAYAR